MDGWGRSRGERGVFGDERRKKKEGVVYVLCVDVKA